jgi:hypothetical protein
MSEQPPESPRLNALGKPLSPSYDPNYKIRTPLSSINRLRKPMRPQHSADENPDEEQRWRVVRECVKRGDKATRKAKNFYISRTARPASNRPRKPRYSMQGSFPNRGTRPSRSTSALSTRKPQQRPGKRIMQRQKMMGPCQRRRRRKKVIRKLFTTRRACSWSQWQMKPGKCSLPI